jgi:hypothetical protein
MRNAMFPDLEKEKAVNQESTDPRTASPTTSPTGTLTAKPSASPTPDCELVTVDFLASAEGVTLSGGDYVETEWVWAVKLIQVR